MRLYIIVKLKYNSLKDFYHATNIGTQRVGFEVGSDSLRRLDRARHM
jgi:hypothetical protein